MEHKPLYFFTPKTGMFKGVRIAAYPARDGTCGPGFQVGTEEHTKHTERHTNHTCCIYFDSPDECACVVGGGDSSFCKGLYFMEAKE